MTNNEKKVEKINIILCSIKMCSNKPDDQSKKLLQKLENQNSTVKYFDKVLTSSEYLFK